ncbi:MAG: NAD(P)H-binding protein, partial [Variovorax sp.]
ALQGVDLVISAVATAMPIGANTPQHVDYEGTVNLSRAARAAGATRFVIITSSVSGKKDHFLNYISADVLIWKKRAEEALMGSGLEYVVVGPAGINDEPGGRKPIRMFPREKYAPGMAINRDDLATVVIAAAALPSAANRTFSVANGSGAVTPDWSRAFGALPAR